MSTISITSDALAYLVHSGDLTQEAADTITRHGREDTDDFHHYWTSVESLAETVREQIREGYDAHDSLWEACDGSYWTIYTHAAMRALEYTDNEGAYVDTHGAMPDVQDFSSLVCALAGAALERDVADRLARMDDEEE